MSAPRRGLLVMGLALSCFSMGQTVLFAVLPPAGRAMGLEPFQIGLVFTVSALVVSLSSPLWGRASDRLGRKRVFVLGMVGYGAFTLVFAVALQLGLAGWYTGWTAFAVLAGTRVLFGLTGGAPHPASTAYTADVTTPEERTRYLALMGAMFGLGSLTGPALGTLLAPFGVLVPLYTAAGLALVATAAAAWLVPAPARRARPAAGPRLRLTDPRVLPLFLAALLNFVAVGAFQQTTAFYVQDRLGLDDVATVQYAGVVFAVMAGATLFAQLVLVQRLRPPPLLMALVGLPAAACGFLLLGVAGGLAALVVTYGLVGLGFGLTQPALMAMVSLQVAPEEQGAAAGWISMAPPMGWVIGPALGAALYQWQPVAPALMDAGLATGALAIMLVLRARHRSAAALPG